MRLTSSSRTGSRTRLGLEELELRWQPAALGLGLSIAALHVPDDLPVVSAVARSGLIGSAGADSATPAAVTPSIAQPSTPATAVSQSSNAPTTVYRVQETIISIGQSAAFQPTLTISTVTFLISQPAANSSGSSAAGTTQSTLGSNASSFGSDLLDRLASAFRPVASPTSLAPTPATAAITFVSTPVIASVVLTFGIPQLVTVNTPVPTTENTLLRSSGLGQDFGTNTAPPPVMQDLNILQSAWIGKFAGAGNEDSGVSKPAQPPADAKKEPPAAQPQMPVDPEIPLAVQIPMMVDPAPQVVASADIVPPTDVAPVSAGVIPSEEESGVSNRTWIGIAATALAIAAGYPIHRWYRQLRRSRPALLVEAGRA